MADTVENIVIKFDADISGMQPAIDILEKTGVVDKQVADQFKKDNDAFNARKKALTETTTAQKQFADNTTASAKSIDAFATASKKVVDSGLNKTLNEFANQTMLGVKDALDEAGVSMEEFESALKKSGITTEATGKTVGSLRQQYRELLAAADAAGGAQTAAGLKILEQAGEIKDRMGDLQASAKAFGSDTRTFDGILQGLQGITAGYQVVMGTQALLGVQDKDLEKTLVKLNAAMAIANGLREIQSFLEKESALQTAIIIPLQRAWGVAVEFTSGAFSSLKGAILATGIGALVVGIGFLISKLIEWNDESTKSKTAQDELTDSVKKGTDAVEENRKAISDSLGKSAKQQKEETELTIEQAKLLIETYENSRKSILANGQVFFDAESKMYKARSAAAQSFADGLNKEAIEEQRLKDRIVEIENEREKNRIEAAKKAAEERAKAEDAALLKKKVTPFDNQKLDNAITLENKIKDVTLRISQSKEDELLKQLREASKQAIELEEEKQQQIADMQVRAAIQNAQVISDAIFQITANSRQAQLDADLTALEKKKNQELSKKGLTEKQKAAIDAKYAKEEARLKNEAAKKAKDAAIAQALIGGALAIINALATVQPYPAAVIAAVSAGIATAAQVAVIASQPLPKYAKGKEYVDGPGTHTSDSILARLSKGERVVPAHINRDYFPALSAIHNGKVTPALANHLLSNIPQLNISQDALLGSLKVNGSGVSMDYDKLARAFGNQLGGLEELERLEETNQLLHVIADKLTVTNYSGYDRRRI